MEPVTRWEVIYELDGEAEQNIIPADSAEHAAWVTARDLAERGFAGRIELVGVYLYPHTN